MALSHGLLEEKVHVRFELFSDAHPFAVDLGIGVEFGRAFFKPVGKRRRRLVQQEMHELMGYDARKLATGISHDIVAFQAAQIQARSRLARSVLAKLLLRIEQDHAKLTVAVDARGRQDGADLFQPVERAPSFFLPGVGQEFRMRSAQAEPVRVCLERGQ